MSGFGSNLVGTFIGLYWAILEKPVRLAQKPWENFQILSFRHLSFFTFAAQGLWAQLRRPVFAHSRLPQTSDEEMIQTKFVAEGAMGTMKWINSNDGSECTKIKHFIYRIRLEWANYQIQMLIRWRSRHWRKEGLKVGSLMDMLNEVTSMRKWSDIISGQKSMKITEL